MADDRPTACPRCGSTNPAEFSDPPCTNWDFHDRPTGAKALPGEHLRPDGTRCSYLVAPGHPFCTKCGGSPTGADDTAARLDARAEKHRSGTTFPTYTSGDADLMRRAAAKLRELEAKVERLQARGIEDMQHQITELREAGDALAARLAALGRPVDVDDLAALDRWEQVR